MGRIVVADRRGSLIVVVASGRWWVGLRGWDRVCLDTVYFAENWKPKTIKIKNKKVTVHKIFTDHMPKFTVHE